MFLTKKNWFIFYSTCLILIFYLFFNYQKIAFSQEKIIFLNVGQGDSTLIITPEKQKILIDGGPESGLSQKITPYLSFFDKTIDVILLTHPDNDHLIGLLDVLEKYQVKQVILPLNTKKNPNYEYFLSQIKARQIPFFFPDSQKDFQIGQNTFIDFLYPQKGSLDLTINSSLIFKIKYFQNEVLFSGDSNLKTEKKSLCSDFNFQSQVYKVGHHGSKTSSSDLFLQSIQPNTAIISAGKENSFGHPHLEVLTKLKKQNIQVFNTQTLKDIILTFP